ncbi:MAG: hypothetical protein HC881_05490 [Leptolyngbyaceae cyanobacterium SL_7_1]|nr:hypothetical protein [Leptolyngbyaceae cyanobacterium SL_7_1]
MARKVNKKCQHCATLSAEAAIALHGVDGDNCWNPDDVRQLGYNCHRRRHHYRHREDDNRTRRRLRKLTKQAEGGQGNAPHPAMPLTQEGAIVAPPPPLMRAAVLVLYRNHKDAPVHAVAAEIWQGDRQLIEMRPVHCMGMRGDQVTTYLHQILANLRENYGVSRFEDVVKEIPVHQCPIEDCPLQANKPI